MEVKRLRFDSHGDERGQLIAIEENRDVPFDIRRVYYIYETKPNVRRGFHAHKRLQQVLVCVHGSCKIMLDNGREKCDVTLDSPGEAIYIANDIWREMYDFSKGAVLLVIASEIYEEADYIRNYDEFLRYVNER